MSLFHLRTTNPAFLGQALAYKRVARGTKWLDRNAPKGWWLRFFTLYPGGTWRCRAYNSYDNECALAIAFESDARFANEFGYVTYGTVLNRLGFDAFASFFRQNGFARSHGFADDETPIDMIRKARGEPQSRMEARIHIVTGEMLDGAWSDQVRKIHYDRSLSPKHYSKYDLAYDLALDRVLRKRPFATRIIDWIVGVRKKNVPAL